MNFPISMVGAVNDVIAREATQQWLEPAEKNGIDVSAFKSDASFEERVAWALQQGLEIGTLYSRFSSKHQQSTADQIRTCVQHAASKGIYCPSELMCADEASTRLSSTSARS